MKMDEVEGTVEFAWFDQLPEAEVIEAVSVLIQLMIEHAKTATRISPKPPEPGNDKYAMRCWLLRLGMIGKGLQDSTARPAREPGGEAGSPDRNHRPLHAPHPW